MKDEIKEILEFDFESQGERIEINEYERNQIKDYITNLQIIEQQYSAILSENVELENKITNLQKEKDKYKNVIDKALYWLSENTHYTSLKVDKLVLDENANLKELLELLEEVE